MSNRTSEANKAIARAWSKEQQRILEGKGTRDWTPEQQQDILDRGKAYGDDGKAFEGHHMKSAEKFPEYQGDSENIQFLSRSEHCAAHYGNFQNSTNGFFNPATNETKDFGLNKYESCETFELNNSIISTGNQAQNTTANTGASAKSSVGDAKATTLSGSSPPTTSGFIGTGKRLAGKTVEFCVRHKKVIGAVASAAATIAAAAAIK
jgi:hypothetical protein